MLKRCAMGLLVGALGGVPCVLAESGSGDIKPVNSPLQHADGTGQFRKSQELVRHARNQARLASQGASAAATSFDAGNVAVIVDNGKILIPPRPGNPFDLSMPSGLRFAPAGNAAFDVSATSTALDTTFGTDLGLGDDDAASVEAADSGTFNSGNGFLFLGTSYTTDQIFVGSDGHITFGEPEASSAARDAGRHIGGPPRLSPLFADLDPTSASADAVFADVRADRVVVTWSELPEFGLTNVNTFQAVLWASGNIDFVYSRVDLLFAVVGLAEGNDEGPINELDLSQDLPVNNLGAGAIFEEFSPAIVVQQMDVIELSKEFYRTHPDKFDFLVMFSKDVVDIGGGAFAFHLGLHRENQGLGFFRGPNTVDDCSAVGLPAGCELESLLNMNRIGLYWPDEQKLVDPPIRKFRFFCINAGGQVVPCGATFPGPPGANQVSLRARWMGTLNGDFGSNGAYTLGLNSAMSIMGQEAGHRWLAFPAFQRPVPGVSLSGALLGRSAAHWSFFFNVTVPPSQFEAQDGDPRASSAEGNAIRDLGPDPRCTALTPPRSRLFQTEPDELIDGFTELDQYFMGLRKASAVPSFWYLRNPAVIFGGGPNASSSARDDVLICGDREDLTVDNITAAGAFLGPSNGPRDPVLGDEQDAGPGIGPSDDAKCTSDRECVDVKTMAFILLVNGDPASHSSVISHVDNFRRVWEEYANNPAVGGLGARGQVGDPDYIKKFDTSLAPAIH